MRVAAAAFALLAACAQPIRFIPDAEPQDDSTHVDAGFVDSGAVDGLPPADGGPADAGPVDSGGPDDSGAPPIYGPQRCPSLSYCIRSVDALAMRVDVREVVPFTVSVKNDDQVSLRFSAPHDEVIAFRPDRLVRPELGQIDYSLNIDPLTGAGSFRVNAVPPWFATTQFDIKVLAQADGGPVVQAVLRVMVLGNTLLSAKDFGAIHAVASDGRPAVGAFGDYPDGLLTAGLDAPQALLLSSDGRLVVYDAALGGDRLVFVTLDGQGTIQSFDTTDDQGQPIFRVGNQATGQIAQRDDGAFVVLDVIPTAAQRSRVILFDENGSFLARHDIGDSNMELRGLAFDGTRLLSVEIRAGLLVTIDEDTGALPDLLFQDLQIRLATSLQVVGGVTYIASPGRVTFHNPPDAGDVAGIDTMPRYTTMARYISGVLVGSDEVASQGNVLRVEGTNQVTPLREEGGVYTDIHGLLFLH